MARCQEIMLDHHRDDPARLLQFTPVRHPRAEQFGVRECRERATALDEGIVPVQLRVAKGVVVVHELTAADMPDDVADRALPSRGNPEPVLGRDGVEVAQQRMPIRSLERLIEERDA